MLAHMIRATMTFSGRCHGAWSIPRQNERATRGLQKLFHEETQRKTGLRQQRNIQPSPASTLCADMAFSVSLFYKEAFICPTLLRRSLDVLASELPILLSRIKRPIFGWQLSSYVLDPRNEKHNIALHADIKPMTIQHSMDMLWKESPPRPLSQQTQYIHRDKCIDPLDELVKFDLVTCTDGSVLTMHIAHIIADAGRAVRLLERLSSIYHTVQSNQNNYRPQAASQYDAWFAKNRGSPRPPGRALTALQLDVSKLMAIPRALKHYSHQKFVSKYLFISGTAIKRLQQILSEMAAHLDLDIYPSKLDVVQAILISLIANVRKGRLTPDENDTVTINIELSRILEETKVSNDALGNSSHILQMKGKDFAPLASTGDITTDSLFINALALRRKINEFKKEPQKQIQQALEQQELLSTLPKHAVLASFLVNGMLEKLASCTAVASFPVDNIQFNGKSPLCHHVDSNPKFDWWSIIQHIQHPIQYENTTLSPGYICHMTVPDGEYSTKMTHNPFIASLSRSTQEEHSAFFL